MQVMHSVEERLPACITTSLPTGCGSLLGGYKRLNPGPELVKIDWFGNIHITTSLQVSFGIPFEYIGGNGNDWKHKHSG